MFYGMLPYAVECNCTLAKKTAAEDDESVLVI